MYLVQFDNEQNYFYSVKEQVYFIGNQLTVDDYPNFAFSDIDDEFSILLIALSEFQTNGETGFNALITADTTINELNQYFPKFNDDIGLLVIYVKDFKDGRTFSLIRHLRNLHYQERIIIAGNYGLDQAGYYFKSGATGFFVKDEQLTTLKKTLDDLKSGHFGNSASSLPMFK